MNALGSKKLHNAPTYSGVTKIGRVTSAADFKTKARIEVQFLDHGKCMPVWVVGDIDRVPKTGDMVVIGYMEGRKDSPYLQGFVRNQNVTSSYIEIGEGYIRFQIPTDKDDTEKHMQDDAKKDTRVYLEITADGIKLHSKAGTQTF